MTLVELRDAPNGALIMHGLASRTETWYPIGGAQEEVVRKGAFARTLSEAPDVALRVEHSNLPLARSTSKSGKPTLTLSENDEGLVFRAELNPRDSDVQDLRAKAEHTDLQCSFAFRCNRDRWDAEMERREVLEVNLHRGDVAICAFGANESTGLTIAERGAGSTLEERRAVADRLSGRVIGPVVGRSTCARCGGSGTIELRCPSCSNAEGDGEPPAISGTVAADGRSLLSTITARNRRAEQAFMRAHRTGQPPTADPFDTARRFLAERQAR